ncbi:hypothetical protein CK203_046140 [Vitis vinifera]|uniref:Reverse transcriptase zinc-binding domain-containing protein n=1 Tax=Vitis vinifera TaxID=29760 RepID=A0A438I4B0_VITVI|nr:hypothetical protein CK203_046140 [Vitis vinifera]
MPSRVSGWVGTEQGLAELLDCKASGWPILYLGLPLGGNPKSGSFWDPVIERISSRLDGWQKAYLSFGGRITLIQSCLTHMPCYFLSLFKIPASMAARIERERGIGFRKDFLRNSALLGKWLWRYPREGSLWHQVILSIYGSHSNGWDANTVVRWSHRCPWKAIAQVFQDFSKFTRFMVGDGERIRFWEDLWWGDQPLGIRDLGLYLLQDFSQSNLSFLPYQISGLPSVFPTKLVWNSQVPFKIKSFVWLVAHKKLTKTDWVPPRSIFDMLSTNFNGFGSSKRGIVLWQAACIALIWVVWRERNARIF